MLNKHFSFHYVSAFRNFLLVFLRLKITFKCVRSSLSIHKRALFIALNFIFLLLLFFSHTANVNWSFFLLRKMKHLQYHSVLKLFFFCSPSCVHSPYWRCDNRNNNLFIFFYFLLNWIFASLSPSFSLFLSLSRICFSPLFFSYQYLHSICAPSLMILLLLELYLWKWNFFSLKLIDVCWGGKKERKREFCKEMTLLVF